MIAPQTCASWRSLSTSASWNGGPPERPSSMTYSSARTTVTISAVIPVGSVNPDDSVTRTALRGTLPSQSTAGASAVCAVIPRGSMR